MEKVGLKVAFHSLDCSFFSESSGEEEEEGEEEEKGEEREAREKKKGEKQLRNQFNFSERASQTLNNPFRVGSCEGGGCVCGCKMEVRVCDGTFPCPCRTVVLPQSHLPELTSPPLPIRCVCVVCVCVCVSVHCSLLIMHSFPVPPLPLLLLSSSLFSSSPLSLLPPSSPPHPYRWRYLMLTLRI